MSSLRGGVLGVVIDLSILRRGALSDLLSAATAAEMARRVPDLDLVTVPDVGHAPALDEPEAVAAIDTLLQRVRVGR